MFDINKEEDLVNTDEKNSIYNYIYHIKLYYHTININADTSNILLKILQILDVNLSSSIRTDNNVKGLEDIKINFGPLVNEVINIDDTSSFVQATINFTKNDTFRLYLLRLLYFKYNIEKYTKKGQNSKNQLDTTTPGYQNDFNKMSFIYRSISSKSNKTIDELMFINLFKRVYSSNY